MEEKSPLPHLPEAKTSQQERVNGREKKQGNTREEKRVNGSRGMEGEEAERM